MAQVVATSMFATALIAQSTKSSVISDVDLSKPFKTREAWRFIATQGPSFTGDQTASGGEEPGEIQVCLRERSSTSCDSQLQNVLNGNPNGDDSFMRPHYLKSVEIVYPRGNTGLPVLFVQTASMHSGDGDQLVLTQVLAYDPLRSRFKRIYAYSTGTNNNQEVRYISAGRLEGNIISVEPTENAPYGYWVTVNSLTPEYAYKKVLRYRSATHYGDNNSLAVIDSEMPNIEQHLEYWKPGMALTLPAGRCPRPRLVHMELWCK